MDIFGHSCILLYIPMLRISNFSHFTSLWACPSIHPDLAASTHTSQPHSLFYSTLYSKAYRTVYTVEYTVQFSVEYSEGMFGVQTLWGEDQMSIYISKKVIQESTNIQ